MFSEISSENSNVDDSGICLPASFCGTNQKLYDILLTPELAKVKADLDSPKASVPDCIPVVVPKDFPEL